ncbi:DUF488 domain-containing protein [Patulibacter sp. S7RM1-6]
MPTLWTIGYERLLPEELAAALEDAGVQRLIDVRFRPQSRRAGMSKTKLGLLLADHRIVYEHRRELGTPPDIRVDYHQGRTAAAHDRFEQYVEEEHGAALDALAAELDDPATPHTALLCLEHDATVCHRRVIAERVGDRLPGLRVVDL